MLEALQTLLITMLGYCAALLIAGSICMALAWLFNHGPTWLKLTTISIVIGFFAYAIIDGIIHHEDGPAYYDEMPITDGSDRYS